MTREDVEAIVCALCIVAMFGIGLVIADGWFLQ